MQPARQVVAAGDLGALRRWIGSEVRVERDQAFELVERAAAVASEADELLARQPAVLPLDPVQRWDQARPGEAAGACLAAGRTLGDHLTGSAGTAAGSTRTAQNLNSGIFPSGSISSIVSTFAAASRKWNGTKHVPGVSRCDTRALSSIEPRRLVIRTKSPLPTPISAASSGFRNTCASGWIA